MENLIVAVIVGLAVFFYLRSLYRNFKSDGSDACGCGSSCAGCEVTQSCEETTGEQGTKLSDASLNSTLTKQINADR